MNNDWKTDKADVFPLIVGQVKNNLQVQEGRYQSHPPFVHFQDYQKGKEQ